MVGILYIILGSLGTLWALFRLSIADYGAANVLLPSSIPWSVYYAVMLIDSLFDIFIGIMGIVNRKRLEKALLLKTLCYIDIGLVVVSTVFASTVLSVTFLDEVFIFVLASIFPILYLIGASKNLKAYRNNQSQQ